MMSSKHGHAGHAELIPRSARKLVLLGTDTLAPSQPPGPPLTETPDGSEIQGDGLRLPPQITFVNPGTKRERDALQIARLRLGIGLGFVGHSLLGRYGAHTAVASIGWFILLASLGAIGWLVRRIRRLDQLALGPPA
jgi:hypothetical protein